jgi:hypothetical protein
MASFACNNVVAGVLLIILHAVSEIVISVEKLMETNHSKVVGFAVPLISVYLVYVR